MNKQDWLDGLKREIKSAVKDTEKDGTYDDMYFWCLAAFDDLMGVVNELIDEVEKDI